MLGLFRKRLYLTLTSGFSFLFILGYFASIGLSKPLSDWKFYQKHGHKDSKWNNFVEEGFTAYDIADCTTTLQKLQEAIGLGCQDPIVYFKFAICSEATGSIYSATQYYELASKGLKSLKASHPYQREIHENFGRLLFAQKKWTQAFEQLRTASSVGNPSFALFFMLAELYSMKGEHDLAAENYFKAISQPTTNIKPEMLGKAYREIARALLKQKNYSQGLEFIKRARELLPNDLDLTTLYNQASSGLQQNQLIQTLESFKSK